VLIQHVSQIGALPQTVIALTVKFERFRASVSRIASIWSASLKASALDRPLRLLSKYRSAGPVASAKDLGCPVRSRQCRYFGAHDAVVPGKTGGRLLRWV